MVGECNVLADDEHDGDGMVEMDLDIMLSGVEKVGNPQFQVHFFFLIK